MDEPKKYLVQTLFDDGDVWSSMKTASEIIEAESMSDCSNITMRIYDVSEFGSVKPLILHGCWSDPDISLRIWAEDEDGNTVFSGFGEDH